MAEDGGCIAWLKGPTAAIYAAYFLSSWGDRMWHFGVGIYLVFFDGNQLRLAAIYGFISSGCVLLLGGVIGDWVDRNRRMKVVRTCLFIQNLSVALSAAGVAVLLVLSPSVQGAGYHVLEAAVVVFAIVAVLASCGYKIAIEKDWIVEVASGNSDRLAHLNAVTRSVNLACKVVSPLLVGQVMTYGSRFAGALFMAGWNLLSVLVEYALLCRVYRLVPSLAVKSAIDIPATDSKQTALGLNEQVETDALVNGGEKGPSNQKANESDLAEKQNLQEAETEEKQKEKTFVCWRLVFAPCIRLVTGWSVYMRQRILLTGLSLAALYMTVLGFDSITIGYIYSQGVSESILGICCGLAAITGIIGTFLYTRFQKWLGLYGTGIISFSVEVSLLLLSLISIWTPGSPFYLYDAGAVNCSFSPPSTEQVANITIGTPFVTGMNLSETRLRRDLLSFSDYVASQSDSDMTLPKYLINSGEFSSMARTVRRYTRDVSNQNNSSYVPYIVAENQTAHPEMDQCDPTNRSKTSVILFLIGIVASRIGLWMADLTVTQLYQEEVVESERGTVGGVQTSLNMLLDMLKFIAVILLPKIHTFGFLVIMSFTFIVFGLVLFTTHVLRETKCKRRDGQQAEDDEKQSKKNVIYKPSQKNVRV